MSRSQPQPPVPQNRPKSPTKGPKPKHFITFQTGLDVKKALSVSDITQLVTNLNAVRSQLTVFRNEASLLASDDPKFLLAKGYLEESPSATELFTAWDTLAKQSIVHLHLALGVLAALLTLLSIHQPYHVLGVPILRALLAPQAGRRLNAHLNSAQTDLVLVALKLWNAMSDYGAGMEKKSVYEAFAWTNKSLFRLFHMRRKGSNDMTIDPFIKPDIRTLYITFVSGFLGTSSPPAVKIAFLEAHRDMFFGIFKRISDDHYLLIRFVLEGCWEGIWSDNRVKRTLKVGLFGDEVLTQLVKLYTRNVSEMPGEESIPADLVHHFFLALCTRPGIGVCFRDGGWYPREEDEGAIDEYSTNDNKPRGSRKLYNPILGRFLKHLRPTEDARQQVLIIRMFQSCTELVGGYWTSSGLAMEPRLSSRWLISTAWATSVISLPVPVHTFTTGNTGWGIDYNSDPPPLSSALGNIIPPVWSRAMITKGLQNVSQLVQYHTATCLTRCLQKYNAVRKSYKTVALALEEESSGNWTTRINELETEVKRRIPTFEVIVGFVQQKCISPELSSQDSAHLSDQSLRSLMIAGSALRLMLLYHKVLPDLPADARYDVGKLLLTGIGKRVLSFSTASDISPEDTVGFKVLCHLHILDLLQHSEQYIWNATLGQSSLRHLLCIYDPTDRSGASEHCGALLHKILAQSALFEHDPGELDIWLGALRAANTGLHIDADEDAKIDENTLDFYSLLDGCIRNCLKSPLEYVELSISTLKSATEMSAGIADTVEIYDASSIASPLLMALLKEFETLTKGENDSRLLMALAVATYLRQVVFGISLKQPNNHYGLRIATRLEYHCSSSNAGSLPQPVLVAIQKEIRLLRNLLHLVEAPSQTIEMQDHEGMVNFRIVIQRIEER
ncbi:hypothetical protein FRB91_004580 [Serendipita sp. 411]|nr:hypothetical protein FRB91_004580 [Serendipita sp. 411]